MEEKDISTGMVSDLVKYNDMGKLMNSIGGVYFDGINGVIDREKALDYYKLAIKEGYIMAYSNAGSVYLDKYNKTGDKKYIDLALPYYQHLADKGIIESYNELGFCYNNSYFPNYQLAIKYFRLGIENKNSISLLNLGEMLMKGIGIEKNYKEALKLFKQSSDMGNDSAKIQIAYMNLNGFGLPKSTKNAIKIYQQLDSDRLALYNLGIIYRDGDEDEKIEVNYKIVKNDFNLILDYSRVLN